MIKPNANDRPRIHVKTWLKLKAVLRFGRRGLNAGIQDVMSDLWFDMTEEEHEAIREQIGFERERK